MPPRIYEAAERQVSALYAEHAAELLHFALGFTHDEELAKDALQETFMRYFLALCDGVDIASPRAWMYRVLHNYLRDRRKITRPAMCVDSEELCSRQDQEIERECLRGEVMQLMRTMLTAGEYKCLHLRAEGLRYDAIAARLNLATGTVGALLSRAIGKLRRNLAPIGGEAR